MQRNFPRLCFTNSAFLTTDSLSRAQCAPSSRSYTKFRKLLPILGLCLFLILIIHQLLRYNFNADSVQTLPLHKLGKVFRNSTKIFQPADSSGYIAAIPNIVHFVHLVGPCPNARFDFPFHQFIAIYSAHYYLQPDTIYIHTNVDEDRIEETLRNSTSLYTQAVTRLPTVQFRYHQVINQTSKGVYVEKLPHKADFVRTDVLKKYGGIYLDDDAYILRNLRPLRHSSFENIIGIQDNGQTCNAVILATRNNDFITAYNALQENVFDGSWDKHSVRLLATLAREFATREQEVLVLPQDAFFPLSWNEEDLHTIYDVHGDDGDNDKDIQDSAAFTEYFDRWRPGTWRRDWRASYVLHGWTSGIKLNFDNDEKMEKVFGRFGGITLEYVLQRNSNFARVVYPAVKDALDTGILDHDVEHYSVPQILHEQNIDCKTS